MKVMNWVVEEKKHIRFYHEWNDKEVRRSGRKSYLVIEQNKEAYRSIEHATLRLVLT